MAKARSRQAARRVKDRWKAKNWYNIIAPPSFDNITIADTLTDNPDKLINRVASISLQDMTNDFRKGHIKLFFKVKKIEENKALTQYEGHTLTSDYLRRMVRRRRSKIEGVYDVNTLDGAIVRIKPFATTDKRIQNSQKRVVRDAMKKTIAQEAKKATLYDFIKKIIDGKLGSDIYKNCKTLYPVKRIEIYKTKVIRQPTVEMEVKKKPEKKTEEKEEQVEEKKTKKDTKKKEKKEDKETKESKGKEDKSEEEVKEPEETEEKENPKQEVKESKEPEEKKEKSKETEKKEKKEKPKVEKTEKKETKKETKKTEEKPEKSEDKKEIQEESKKSDKKD